MWLLLLLFLLLLLTTETELHNCSRSYCLYSSILQGDWVFLCLFLFYKRLISTLTINFYTLHQCIPVEDVTLLAYWEKLWKKNMVEHKPEFIHWWSCVHDNDDDNNNNNNINDDDDNDDNNNCIQRHNSRLFYNHLAAQQTVSNSYVRSSGRGACMCIDWLQSLTLFCGKCCCSIKNLQLSTVGHIVYLTTNSTVNGAQYPGFSGQFLAAEMAARSISH